MTERVLPEEGSHDPKIHADLESSSGDLAAMPSAKQLEALMVEKEVAELEKLATRFGGGGVATILAALGSDAAQGLSGDHADLAKRQARFGCNYFDEKPPTNYLKLWWDAMHDGAIVVLCVMAVITFIVWVTLEAECNPKGWMEPAALIFSINVITHTTAIIDFTKERMFAKLTSTLDASNKKFVIRNGQTLELADREIVVGDVMTFNSHNAASIPADGLLLAGSGVKMDEASLTGEPEPMAKSSDANPFILSGTVCAAGSGKLLVIAVGPLSVSGKIKAAVYGAAADEEDEGSPLFVKLDVMAMRIGKAGMFVALLAFVVMLVLGVLARMPMPGGAARDAIIHYMVQAITILAVAVPEGLPLAVTLSLAFSSSQMMKDNNLVKQLKACETMGSATTICSDKTGTLTANRMTVRGACLAGHLLPALDPRSGGPEAALSVGARAKAAAAKGEVREDVLQLLGTLIAVNTMDESTVEPPASPGEQAIFKGNPSDCALLNLAADLGTDWRALRTTTPGRSEATLAQGAPFMFSSARKMMSWAVPLPSGGHRVFTKGASEIVLGRCTRTIDRLAGAGAPAVALAEEEKESFYLGQIVANFAGDAMRTLAFAFKDYPADAPEFAGAAGWKATTADATNADGTDAFVAETDLTLIGVVGIEDPLRDEVPPAIARCYGAGIDVRMCTGDNLATAVAIASRCGILRDEHFTDGSASGDVSKLKPDRAMTGKEFRRRVHDVDDATGEATFNQEVFDKIWPRLRVMARCDPEDKNTLAHGLNKSMLFQNAERVRELKQEGITIFPDRQVVAMTGDGTNDAPALNRADVGFAMGISGTQIAKDAADIILLDDNFASIVTAAKWGRNVYESICKFLQFQLTVNIAAIACALVGAFRDQSSPIAAVQMLWINLIMDSLASIALATEPPADELLDRPPVNRSESIISEQMWYNMFGHAFYQIVVMMALYYPSGPTLLGCESGFDPSGGGGGGGHRRLSRFGEEEGSVAAYDDEGQWHSSYDTTAYASAVGDADAAAAAAAASSAGGGIGGVGRALLLANATHTADDGDDGGCPATDGYSVHYTCIFNTFVMMTLFNEINCRKLRGEANVFEGITKNPYFIVIWFATFAIQAVGAQWGSGILQVADEGLNLRQWLICMGFGLGVLPWQFVINGVKGLLSEGAGGGGTRGRRQESGILKFGTGRLWFHNESSKNTSVQRVLAAHSSAKQA